MFFCNTQVNVISLTLHLHL